jgi:hypothetical protein
MLKLKSVGLMSAAIGIAILGAALIPTTASSQGGYYGQRATQDRDYSRMQSATQRAYGGKTETVTMGKKKKKKKRVKHKRKHRHNH